MWKKLIHDKHEAFRFKYDTSEINNLEKKLMPGIKMQLYIWTIIYYVITFVLPYFFIQKDCGKTFDNGLFVIYGAYLFLSGVWEIWTVIRI